jgi:hypothetical protein
VSVRVHPMSRRDAEEFLRAVEEDVDTAGMSDEEVVREALRVDDEIEREWVKIERDVEAERLDRLERQSELMVEANDALREWRLSLKIDAPGRAGRFDGTFQPGAARDEELIFDPNSREFARLMEAQYRLAEAMEPEYMRGGLAGRGIDRQSVDAAWRGQASGVFASLWNARPDDVDRPTVPGEIDWRRSAVMERISRYMESLDPEAAGSRALAEAWKNWAGSVTRAEERARARAESPRQRALAFARERRAASAAQRARERRARAEERARKLRRIREWRKRRRRPSTGAPCQIGDPLCETEGLCYRSCGWPGRVDCVDNAADYKKIVLELKLRPCAEPCGVPVDTWGQWFARGAQLVADVAGPIFQPIISGPLEYGAAVADVLVPVPPGPSGCTPAQEVVVGIFPWAHFGPCCASASGCAHTAF